MTEFLISFNGTLFSAIVSMICIAFITVGAILVSSYVEDFIKKFNIKLPIPTKIISFIIFIVTLMIFYKPIIIFQKIVYSYLIS